MAYHLTGTLVDGSLTGRIVEAGEGESSDTLTTFYHYLLTAHRCPLTFYLSPDLHTIRHVRVVTRFFDAVCVTITIAHRNMDGLPIGQDDRNLGGSLPFVPLQDGSDSRCRGTCPCRQSTMQWIEIWQQLLHHPAQSVGTVDGMEDDRYSRAFEYDDLHSLRLCSFHFLLKATG